MKKYDIAVYIGRFQPLHTGHILAIKTALSVANKAVVLVGSSFTSRSIKNPFTFTERKELIESAVPQSYTEIIGKELEVKPIVDHQYNESRWIGAVRFSVNSATDKPNPKVAIIGYEKDSSSYYLKNFPDWDFIPTKGILDRDGEVINATDIRTMLFDNWSKDIYSRENDKLLVDIHKKYGSCLVSIDRGVINSMVDEYNMVKDYKKSWEGSPFPPTFNCCDAVVIQSGHVLMIRRKDSPGKGFYALPGGFIDQNETALMASIRELREETRMKVPTKVLLGSLFAQHVFDDPSRSTRGRTFSHAFGYALDDTLPLPDVRGGDDADKAIWVPFETLRTNEFRELIYEDHASIIDWFLARV
jgi:bifunctional NMN adenylyltransferase/nudix hydrolase